jgi:hypothetical protein
MKFWEAEPIVVRLVGPIYQHDAYETFHNATTAKPLQGLYFVPYVHATTYFAPFLRHFSSTTYHN